MHIDASVRRKIIIASLLFIGIPIIISIVILSVTKEKDIPASVTQLPASSSSQEQIKEDVVDGSLAVYNIEALRGQNLSERQTTRIIESLGTFINKSKEEALSYVKINASTVKKSVNSSNGVIQITFTVTTNTTSTYDVVAAYVGTTDMFVRVFEAGTTNATYTDPYDTVD